jgi:hypothetical protein
MTRGTPSIAAARIYSQVLGYSSAGSLEKFPSMQMRASNMQKLCRIGIYNSRRELKILRVQIGWNKADDIFRAEIQELFDVQIRAIIRQITRQLDWMQINRFNEHVVCTYIPNKLNRAETV